jgi:hypothetical protein
MSRVFLLVLALGVMFVGLVGCGGSGTQLNTAPLTDEQKAQIKADDQRIDEEESPDNRTRKGKGR